MGSAEKRLRETFIFLEWISVRESAARVGVTKICFAEVINCLYKYYEAAGIYLFFRYGAATERWRVCRYRSDLARAEGKLQTNCTRRPRRPRRADRGRANYAAARRKTFERVVGPARVNRRFNFFSIFFVSIIFFVDRAAIRCRTFVISTPRRKGVFVDNDEAERKVRRADHRHAYSRRRRRRHDPPPGRCEKAKKLL